MGMELSLIALLPTPENPATLPEKTPPPSRLVDSQFLVETDIRIYQDGLLIARCSTRSIAPARLFARIDPLPYPVNTCLEIEFISGENRESGMPRLPVTVIQRSISGIELRISSGLASTPHTGGKTR